MKNHYHLAGDIGGTKTILALFSSEKGPLKPLHEIRYTSSSYPGLDAIIRDFFSQTKASAQTACFGVAGPVRGGRAVITNLPWQPDSDMLQASHGFTQVTLINDLVATGYAIPHLEDPDIHTLNLGMQTSGGALGIIAPGTGLGEVVFTWDGSRYLAVPSEGGHVDFGPSSATEARLLDFLKMRYGHVSYDRICSGPGLSAIYDFYKSSGELAEPDWLAEKLAAADDPAPVIVSAALDTRESCDICIKTLRMFISVLGAEAGNLALKGLTTGGMYLGGGIPPRILSFLEEEPFMDSFASKGRMSYLLHDIPVRVILNPKAALIGAAAFGLGLEFVAP
ncbi:MAG: glucokinase [Desulfobacterales bacterium SG8_35]|nr:MAG: glucokinase [Desulfobacterales bacterium SG8_35]